MSREAAALGPIHSGQKWTRKDQGTYVVVKNIHIAIHSIFFFKILRLIRWIEQKGFWQSGVWAWSLPNVLAITPLS